MSSFTCEYPRFFFKSLPDYRNIPSAWFVWFHCLPAMSVLSSTDTGLPVWPLPWWTTIGCPPTTSPEKPSLLSATSAGRGDRTPQRLARASSLSFCICLAVNPVVLTAPGSIIFFFFCFLSLLEYNIGFLLDQGGVGLGFQLLFQCSMKSHSIERYFCQVWNLCSSVFSPLQRSQSWGCWTPVSGTARLRSLSAGWRRLRSRWRRSKGCQCCPCWCFLTTSCNMCFCTGTMFTIFKFFFFFPMYCLFSNYTKMGEKKEDSEVCFCFLTEWTSCHCATLCRLS